MIKFIGEYTAKMDDKGRIVFPSPFKALLPSDSPMKFVVKKDIFERCLVVYPFGEWERLMDDLRSKINPYNREHTRFMREFQCSTAELQLDGNGRFLVPRRLMQAIGADKDVVLLGVDRHIELWDAATYDSQHLSADELGNLAEKILGQGG